MGLRPATPEEIAQFQAAARVNEPKGPVMRGGVPKNYPVPHGDEVIQFEDNAPPDSGAKPIATEQGVSEPGGAPASAPKLRPATPEEQAQFVAAQGGTPAVAADAAPPVRAQDKEEVIGDQKWVPGKGWVDVSRFGAFGEGLTNPLGIGTAVRRGLEHLLGTSGTPAGVSDLNHDEAKAAHPVYYGLGQATSSAPAYAALPAAAAPQAVGGAALGGLTAAGEGEDPLIGAAAGGVGSLAGTGAANAVSQLTKRFPEIADLLAQRLTGQTSKQVASRLIGTAKGNFQPGQYANDVLDLGLVHPTSTGGVQAGVNVAKEAGSQLGALREGVSAPAAEVESLIQKHMQGAPKEAAEAMAGMLNNLHGNPQGGAAWDAAMRGDAIPLDNLAQLTEEHIGDPLKQMGQKASVPNAPYVNPQNIKALAALKNDLEALQKTRITLNVAAKGGDPAAIKAASEAYDAARKNYAIASGVTKGEAKTVAQKVARRGTGALIGLKLGGIPGLVVGGAVGDRPAAYAALKAYDALRSPAVQAISKLAKGAAGPAGAALGAQVAKSQNPVHAGVALQQTQANDPAAREALKEED